MRSSTSTDKYLARSCLSLEDVHNLADSRLQGREMLLSWLCSGHNGSVFACCLNCPWNGWTPVYLEGHSSKNSYLVMEGRTFPLVSKLEKSASLRRAYGVSPCLMKTQKSPLPCSSRSHMMGSRWSTELSIPDIIDDIRENKKELRILTLSSPSLSLPLSFFSPLFPFSSSFSRNHIFME